eukprot:s2200_g11.t2
MSGAVTERGTARPPKLAQLPPAGPSGAVTARSAFAKRTIDEAGINYLNGAKVGSVKGYLMVSGTILGKPHTSSRPGSSTPRPRTRFDSISEMAGVDTWPCLRALASPFRIPSAWSATRLLSCPRSASAARPGDRVLWDSQMEERRRLKLWYIVALVFLILLTAVRLKALKD